MQAYLLIFRLLLPLPLHFYHNSISKLELGMVALADSDQTDDDSSHRGEGNAGAQDNGEGGLGGGTRLFTLSTGA